MTNEMLSVMAGGFLSSAHCIGMCGGFAGAIGSARARIAPLVARQLVYNAGRVFTYAFLGMIAGAAGMRLSGFAIGPINLQQAFALLAGLLMVGLGLSGLGLLPLPARWKSAGAALFAPLFNFFLNAKGWWGYFLAGIANGYLPCGLVYAFLALAAASGDALTGTAVMVFFGLGTLPAMLSIGLGARLLSPALRSRVMRVAAVFVIALGALTVYRGWPTRAGACCEGKETLRVAGEH